MANREIKDKSLDRSVSITARESGDILSASLLQILGRRRWTVLVTTVLALAGGFLYLQYTTPLYTSTSKVLVEQTGPQIFERDTSGVIARWDKYLYTQAEQLQSTPILLAALKTLGTAKLETWANVNNPMAVLRSNLEVLVGRKDEIISVSFVSPYPEEAAQIVNTLVDCYISAHEQRKRSTLGEVVRILKDERTKRNEDLLAKLQKMMEFTQRNEGLALGTDQDTNVIVRELERLSAALTDAQLATLEGRSFYEAVRKMADNPSGLRQLAEARHAQWIYAATSDQSSSLRAELKRMECDKADLLQALKTDHPAITALDTEIRRTRGQLAELDEEYARGLLAAAEQQYLAARERERELQRHVDEQRQQAVQLNKQITEYILLQSDYQQTTKLCDLLDNSIQRLDVSTEVGALNISILDTAVPALKPSHPQKARSMSVALALGLLVGVGLALLRDWRDQRLRSAQEIYSLLGLPVLGVVPSIGGPREPPEVRAQIVRTNPDSRPAEAFRTFRTAIFFGAPKGEATTILITSPAPGEGKSTIVANLGIAIAQTGQRVLVLDADLRRPVQHKIFGVDRKAKGLSLVLAGEMTLEDAVEHSDVENLDVLTCGPDVSNPAEMLNSDRFSRLINKLSSEYERVLVDSPPVTTVTDAQILGALCKVTVVVLRAELSTRRMAIQAREALASVSAKVIGVVVNDVSSKGDRYGYSTGSYGYCYRHGADEGNGHRKARQLRRRETVPAPAVKLQNSKATTGESSIHGDADGR